MKKIEVLYENALPVKFLVFAVAWQRIADRRLDHHRFDIRMLHDGNTLG